MFKAFIAAVLAATSAQAADRFDLICSGSTHISTPDGDQSTPIQRHYRVDTKAKRWCADECGAVHPIAEVQEAYLKLEPSADESTPEGHKTFAAMIDRITGEETVIYSIFGRRFYTSELKAQCKPAPFSGFPRLGKQF